MFNSRFSSLYLLISTLLFSTQSLGFESITTELPLETHGKLFTISGSNTIGADLAPNWVKEYLKTKGATAVTIKNMEQSNEYRVEGINDGRVVYIDIRAHGSSTGFKELKNKTTDIAISSRAIKDKESNALAPNGLMTHYDSEHVVAIDGLAIITNTGNPIKTLSIDQVAKVFSGEIDNWQYLGGHDLPISIYARDENSGTWDTFKSLVLKKTNKLKVGTPRFESNDLLSKLVSEDIGAIGFVGLASVHNSQALAISDKVTTPLSPKPALVATEDYPLSRRLYIYNKPDTQNPYVKDFIAFVQSDLGQKIVSKVGFVSQKPISFAVNDDIEGPRGYMDFIQFGERLSINFRFQEGSSSLDNKAKRDVRRLIHYIKHPDNKNKKIQLIGFGDLKKSEQRSLVLSKLRALAVKFELQREGVSTEPVRGFGAFLPVASNTGSSKTKNQRVEVWIFNSEDALKIQANKPNYNNYPPTLSHDTIF